MGSRIIKILILLFIAIIIVAGINKVMVKESSYYVDSNNASASDAGPGSLKRPWKSLAAINGRNFSPGDTVYFAAGSSYSGHLTISSSGNVKNPIQLKSYKNGNKPVLSNLGALNALTITGDYIIVDGLKFSDTATAEAWDTVSYKDSGAILIRQGSDNITIKNSEFTSVGVGVKSYGEYTDINNNYFHDLVISYTDSTQSYGALGVSINNSNATISYNRFINCRSTDSPYGADGGAIEIEGYDNNKNNINIHHNYSLDTQGFIEVTETQANNVTIAFNISDDYQQFLAFDTTTTPNNFKVDNNTVIRTRTSNVTSVFTVFYYREEGPLPSDSWLNIKNNIFYTPGAKVLNGSYSYKPYEFPHSYNLYYDRSSDPVGYSLGVGDSVAEPQFVDYENHDLHLSSSSPAINAGASLGYSLDYDNNTVPAGGTPDKGAYEYQGSVSQGLN